MSSKRDLFLDTPLQPTVEPLHLWPEGRVAPGFKVRYAAQEQESYGYAAVGRMRLSGQRLEIDLLDKPELLIIEGENLEGLFDAFLAQTVYSICRAAGSSLRIDEIYLVDAQAS